MAHCELRGRGRVRMVTGRWFFGTFFTIAHGSHQQAVMGVYRVRRDPTVVPALSSRWGVLEPETFGFSVGGYVVDDEGLGVC